MNCGQSAGRPTSSRHRWGEKSRGVRHQPGQGWALAGDSAEAHGRYLLRRWRGEQFDRRLRDGRAGAVGLDIRGSGFGRYLTASRENGLRTEQTSAAERLETWALCLSETTASTEEMLTGWFYSKKKGSGLAEEHGMVSLADLHEGNV